RPRPRAWAARRASRWANGRRADAARALGTRRVPAAAPPGRDAGGARRAARGTGGAAGPGRGRRRGGGGRPRRRAGRRPAPRAAGEAFLGRVREGRVEVCALPYSVHTEAYSIDELARTLRFADSLREAHGVEIVTAMQTDVPGAVPGFATLLASAGVRYLAVAHNYAGRSVPYLHGGQELRRPFWWRTAAGARVL